MFSDSKIIHRDTEKPTLKQIAEKSFETQDNADISSLYITKEKLTPKKDISFETTGLAPSSAKLISTNFNQLKIPHSSDLITFFHDVQIVFKSSICCYSNLSRWGRRKPSDQQSLFFKLIYHRIHHTSGQFNFNNEFVRH